MKRRLLKSLCAFVLLSALLLTSNGLSEVASAAKKTQKTPKLSAKTVTVKVGKNKKVTLKNKPAKAKVKWSTKNKKIATVKNGKITGKKAGSTKVICAVTYKKAGKKVTKKLSVKVKVVKAENSTKNPVASASAGPGVTASSLPTATVTVAPTATPDRNIPKTVTDGKASDSNLTTEHTSYGGVLTKDNGIMRTNLSTLDLTNDAMGIGWNLGNQMEQSNWQGGYEDLLAAETSAGNPKATQETFDGLKSYGINTVRVPVAWSNFISDDGKFTLNEGLLTRVEEIINYALNDEMYIIINIHWDGAWWGMFGAEEFDAAETPIRDEAWKKYEAIWTQLAERYKEYSDHLIFEGANEELSGRLNDDYTHPEKGQQNQTGKLNEDQIYTMVNAINQKFVDIVRASGGNNLYRHLLIPGTGNESCVIGGYAGDVYKTDGTMDDRYKMPEDTKENENSKLSVSIHFYDPTDYGISATSTTPWGYRDTWGTDKDKQEMKDLLGRMQKFTDQGYGVIVGECGCVKGYKDGVIDYFRELFTLCDEMNYCPVMWDEGHYYNRESGYFTYGDVGGLIAELTGSNPVLPEGVKLMNTGITVVPSVENTNPKVCYTWEGEFMRHTGDGEIPDKIMADRGEVFDPVNHGIYYTTSIKDGEGNDASDKMQVACDDEFWNIHMSVDWSQIKEPCIKVYPADNEESQGSDLQVGYMKDEKSGFKFDVDYDQNTGSMWVGKYIKLDREVLVDGVMDKKGDVIVYPWLWLTTNTYTGASYVKVEICDGAYNADGTEYVSSQTAE